MNPINIQSINDYPDDYTWLSIDDQQKIINYMNGMQELANRYYETYRNNIEEYKDLGTYIKQYNHTVTSLTGSKNAYATLGIMVEYDWPKHKGKWFLATKTDAIFAENYQEEDENPTINKNILLDYTEIGQ